MTLKGNYRKEQIYLSVKACSRDKIFFQTHRLLVNVQQSGCMKAKPWGEKTGCTSSLAITSDKVTEAEPEHWCLHLWFNMTHEGLCFTSPQRKTNDTFQMQVKRNVWHVGKHRESVWSDNSINARNKCCSISSCPTDRPTVTLHKLSV